MATALCAESRLDTLASSASSSGVTINGGSTPSLTIEGGNSGITLSSEQWQTTGTGSTTTSITWGTASDSNLYTPKASGATINGTQYNETLKTFELSFNKTNANNRISAWDNNASAGVSASSSATTLTIDFQNKGLKLAPGGYGLNINFGSDNNNASENKTIIVQNLSKLEGDLTIFGGQKSNTFTIDIGEMVGDISLRNGNIDDDTGTINISESLQGSIWTNNANMGRDNAQGTASPNNGVKINLTSGATMIGDILGEANGMDSLKKIVTFSGASNPSQVILTGNIISYGTNAKTAILFDKSAGNHITFEAGSMQGSIIASNSFAQVSRNKKGYNNITFGKTGNGSTHTLTGGILAWDKGNNFTHQSTNTITLQANTTLTIVANPNGNSITDSKQQYSTRSSKANASFTLTTGSIVASGGSNEINLNAGSVLTLDSIITGDSASASATANYSSQNDINNLSQSKTTITFKGSSGTSTINGNIKTANGVATITTESSATGVINGDITSSGGMNHIKAVENTTLTLTGKIESSSSGKNVIAGSNASTNTLDGMLSDSDAFTGSLTIGNGVSSSGGANYISFKSSTSSPTQSTSIISVDYFKALDSREGEETPPTIGNAISTSGGSNNIYLNASQSSLGDGVSAIGTYVGEGSTSQAYKTLAQSSIIAGHISTSAGSTNLKVVGKGNGTADSTRAITNGSQIAILGNVLTSGGTSNIVLENSFIAPSELITVGNDIDSIHRVSIGGENSGVIETSGGTANVVTRFTPTSPQGTGYSIYTIENSGNANTNIVLQGDYRLGINADYAQNYDSKQNPNGVVSIIFASSSDLTTQSGSATDNFSSSGQTDVSGTNSKVIGVTYKNGLKLTLKDKKISVNGSEASFIQTYGKHFTAINEGKVSTFLLDRTGTTTDTIHIRGLVLGSITPLEDSSAKNFDVTIAHYSAYVGSVALPKSQAQPSQVNLTMKRGSKLITDNDLFYVNSLTILNAQNPNNDEILLNTFEQKNTIIDLASGGNNLGSVGTRTDFRLFAVSDGAHAGSGTTGVKGDNALFRVYVNDKAEQSSATLGGAKGKPNQWDNTKLYSDRILINSGNGSGSKHYIQAIYDNGTDISTISYKGGGSDTEGNIAVATVKSDTNVTFEGAKQIQGFDLVGTTLESTTTDKSGKYNQSGAYTTYFISKVQSDGTSTGIAQATASAMGLNYELFLANFNSLNKRMGELRENDHSQGAWARVFNGQLSTSFGLNTKSTYTTIQAGYDYAFGFEGANNYLGVALSYANSVSKSNEMEEYGVSQGLLDSTTNGVEVAIYNSYVQDEGWFNDTIAKFSYMMSDLKVQVSNAPISQGSNNYGLVLSDEFGYRFKLGGEKEWVIDPQLELGVGYFNQSDLQLVLGGASLKGAQQAIYTLRARLGANWGYDFKKFTQGKGVNASLYVGTYYSYDYIAGGELSFLTNLGKHTSLNTLASTGRFELNVGTNVTIKDNTRIYFDFEKSFGGKLVTDYQVNVGVRYSFGESNGYTPAVAKAKEVAPLKVEEVKNTQENQAQESKTTQESR